MSPAVFDLVSARRWAVTARLRLAGARGTIDSLNVFPVPDGDTGTNMYLTVDGALDYVRGQFELGAGTQGLREGLTLIARGMLLSARGNSGVILAQLTRGLAQAVDPEVQTAGPEEIAVAFETAARTAWDALATPVEGTILTVARATAEGARAAVDRAGAASGERDLDAAVVVREALDAARDALSRTPEQLPELRAAGVVDAGGAGLVLVIEALLSILEGRPPDLEQELPGWWDLPPGHEGGHTVLLPHGPEQHEACPGDDGAGQVEVMYLLADSDRERAARLRGHLDQIGSSVVVAGGGEDYRVHVHLDDPRAAVEAGSLAGVVSEVRLTSLRGGQSTGMPSAPESTAPLAVVACALGEGVARLFADAGAHVVSSGPRRRTSAGQLLAAVRVAKATRVVVLPNDVNTLLVAQAVADEARRSRIEVDVVPTCTLLEGLAAIAVLDPEGTPDEVVSSMAEAAREVRNGALSAADRDADTPAGPCRAGQWLAIHEHEIVAVEDEPAAVARAVLDLLWGEGCEVVTVLLGEHADGDLGQVVAAALADRARVTGSAPEVVILRGDQPAYPVLLGVE